ncbi:hypothetical protein Leryth_007709 [Lithospermum erythrorhizon]|nr:hypothetical protein Leryth_007709 [Lithospermum erythrorhizon]
MFFCMRNYIFLLASLIIAFDLVVPFNIVHGSKTICSQTLYPELCNSLVSTKADESTLDETTTLNLRGTSLQVTLAQASHAHELISNMDVSSLSELGKSAWANCVQLHEDTIELVNKSISLDSSTRSSSDAQTWLSAAFANQQTCLNGFLDFNLHEEVQKMPIFSNDLSKYISNSLAINKATTLNHATINGRGRRLLSSHGFPKWVTTADRRLLQSTTATMKANIVVAQDGSGSYKTIKEAVAAAGGGGGRFVIYVKKGVYREQVVISKSKKNLMFIGDGIDQTIVTGSKNAQDGSTTFDSATFAVSGDGFVAKDMTFENTAGPQKHQAVALRSGSDFSVFYRCSFKGYQDTLYVYAKRQFYRDCTIYGTQDFIFGDAVAVLQNCNIYIRKSLSGQRNTVTASGRSDPNENTGIIIQNSRVSGDSQSGKSFLGRPWQKYSRTVFMKCSLDSVIDPAGWLPWSGNFALSTLYYGEYMNTGAGAGTGGRVKWPGYHVITSATEASKFSVGNFLSGNSWIPATGVPFTSAV